MKKTIILFVLLLSLMGLAACSQNESLSVTKIWARPGRAEGNSAVFFEIDNPTGEDDRLLSASSNIAQAVELHRTKMLDGVMNMERQEFVPVPAGEQVVFKTGDLHLMLIGLNQDLLLGDSFQVVLTFEKAGDILLDVTVQEE